uniref:Uncharacterized protein n=1 Tax=Calidris pygmaea TaxID=425635 RepID=A0A8C3JEV6_9CHAR
MAPTQHPAPPSPRHSPCPHTPSQALDSTQAAVGIGMAGLALPLQGEPSVLGHPQETTESHGVGRDLWSSSSPTPLPNQVHLEQVAQEHVQAGFECLQRRRLHHLSGQPVELHIFKFVPISSCPAPGQH